MQEGARASLKPWSAQSALVEMDRNGVETGIGFLGSINGGDVAAGRHTAPSWNELGAGLQRDWPGRFGTFAVLPMLDVEGSHRGDGQRV